MRAACGGTEAETPVAVETVRSIPVRTATVQTRDLAETLSLTGTLDPRAQVTVVPEISARLERVLKNEGDRVARGQLLAVLDDADFRLARDRAKAYLDVAEANRAHAQAEKDRADSLLKTGGITDKDHLAAQVAVQVADASHAQARSELAIAERQVGRTQITAPISGRIAKRHADAGTIVAAGHADLHDRRRLGVRVPLVGRVRRFRQGEGGRERHRHRRRAARVRHRRRSEPHCSAGRRAKPLVRSHHSRSGPARARLRAVRPRAGESARRADSLTVPPAALLRDGSDPTKAQTYVVVEQQGRAARRAGRRRSARRGSGDQRPQGRRSRRRRSAERARARHAGAGRARRAKRGPKPCFSAISQSSSRCSPP